MPAVHIRDENAAHSFRGLRTVLFMDGEACFVL